MPEIGLGIGTEVGTYHRTTTEWLYWYDELGKRYPTEEEARQQERQTRLLAEQRLEQEQKARLLEAQQVEKLAARLRELGIDPE
ncbi:hypothetical protein [Okeania sp.]|uniref:hypothetical protein n=1 Tax=Okeania sp. TaxID=3100323 RepID=UPI002B4B3928|nr:hypothetical protein [Okeania sp.]MEB3339377.1 hypothetical protein [Okeania sp.]